MANMPPIRGPKGAEAPSSTPPKPISNMTDLALTPGNLGTLHKSDHNKGILHIGKVFGLGNSSHIVDSKSNNDIKSSSPGKKKKDFFSLY